LNLVIKVLIVLVFIWIIFQQIKGKSSYTDQWFEHLSMLGLEELVYLIVTILLIPWNIFFESRKWWILVNSFEKHSRRSAFLSILVGMPAAMITPARLGEYVGRLMYIKPENNWKAIWSNLACGISQGLQSILGGLIGLSVFLIYHINLSGTVLWISLSGALILMVSLSLLYYNLEYLPVVAKKFKLKKYLSRMVESMDMVYALDVKLLNKVMGIASLRYLIFITQYFLILRFWGVQEPVHLLYAGISIIFLIQTVMPFPPFINVLARGEIALLILGLLVDNSLSILSAAFSLWIINMAFPALIGLLFMLNINISKSMGYD